MSGFSDSPAVDIERLVKKHAPGWGVRVHRDEGEGGAERVHVELSHPLSDGLALDSGPPGTPFALERLEAWLVDPSVVWEVEVLSTAPEPAHPEAIRALRAYAGTFAWTNHEVQAIAGILADSGALSDEEYEWVRIMVGEDAPGSITPNPAPSRARKYSPPSDG